MRPIALLILTLGGAASLRIDVVDWKQAVSEEVAMFNNGFWEKVYPPAPTDGNWTWRLRNSLMEPITEEGLCNVLPGDVLVIGDSVSRYSFLNFQMGLKSIMNRTREQTATKMSSEGEQWQDDEGVPQGEQLSFSLCNSARKFTHVRTDGGNLIPEALLSENSVVIFNTGAHHTLSTKYTHLTHLFITGKYNESVINAVNLFKKYPQYGHNIFFRTTVPGTPDCDQKDHLPPYTTVAEAEKDKVFTEHPFYNGDEFKLMNEIASDLFIAAGYSVLDAYAPSILRQDGHRGNGDCLHYRDGAGPQWHWYKLFYNTLLRRLPNHRSAT
jgi:hypothetical protein